MKWPILLFNLATIASCLVIERRNVDGDGDLDVNTLATNSLAHKVDIVPVLNKRNTYDDYAAAFHNNLIPDYITVNDLVDGANSRTYSRAEIWAALELAWPIYTAWYPTRFTASPVLRPSWSGNLFPHAFRGADTQLQGTSFGDGDPNWMWAFPLGGDTPRDYDTIHGQWESPLHAGADRVVFDGNGIYMGVITHRGEIRNQFHWGMPTNAVGAPLPAPQGAPYPGTPNHGLYVYVTPPRTMITDHVYGAMPLINTLGGGGSM